MKPIEELRAEEKAKQAEYEAKTTVTEIAGRAVKIAELRACFEKYIPPSEYWKAPFRVLVNTRDLPVFLEAVRFYHADEPTVGKAITRPSYREVLGRGYQG